MARPLRYDDQFVKILDEKIKDKFLFCLSIKVQSTAFYKRLNLKSSLLICGVYDFLIGVVILFNFSRLLQMKDDIAFKIECIVFIFGIFFGILGVDAANNLRKLNSAYYLLWRMFVTFGVPVLEIVAYPPIIEGSYNVCFLKNNCGPFYFIIALIIYFCLNIYLTKISWSFSTRLNLGHELLVIHGKYLEQMMIEENYKIQDAKKYTPPDGRDPNAHKMERELIQIFVEGTDLQDKSTSKTNNPFFKAMQRT